jgi:methylsterol monooxygenase
MDGRVLRVIIRVCVSEIPGDPQRRHTTLGEAVCRQVLNREFTTDLQASGYDHVHIPADFDSDGPLNKWFIFDFGVKEELSTDEVLQIPHLVFLARLDGDKW